MKFSPETNSNEELDGDVYFFCPALKNLSSSSKGNLIMLFIFSVFEKKYSFGKNSSHIIKSVVDFDFKLLNLIIASVFFGN